MHTSRAALCLPSICRHTHVFRRYDRCQIFFPFYHQLVPSANKRAPLLGGEAAPGGAGFVRGPYGRPRLGFAAVGHPAQLVAAGRVPYGKCGRRLYPAAAHQRTAAHQGGGQSPAAAPRPRRSRRWRRKEEEAGGGSGQDCYLVEGLLLASAGGLPRSWLLLISK